MFDLNNKCEASDDKLVACAKEDKECYSCLASKYGPKIRAYLGRITNDQSELDDLVQQALLNSYAKLKSFDEEKKFSSWLYAIAHNVAINWLKKKKPSTSIEDQTEMKGDIWRDDYDILRDYVVKKETKKNISASVKKLPEKYRRPIEMRYLEDKSYEEISFILGKPTNTIGTLINRGKKMLKEELASIYQE